MSPNRVRTAAEEELMEAQLDTYNQKRRGDKDTDDDADEKPARRSRQSKDAETKAGRWVAPIVLMITIVLSGIFWLIQKINNPQ